MESNLLSSPNPKKDEYGHELAYKLACEQLAKIDVEKQCLNSGTRCQVIDSKKVIILEYLNRSYQITLPQVEISLIDSEEKISIRDKILILHYFAQAKGTPLTNKTISYKEIPEGVNYFPTFYKRAIRPLVNRFGKEPHLLINTAEKLGGHKVDYGDIAVTVNAFSRVPITLVLWQEDEEFAPEGSILFDSSITDYFSTDDINVLCETIAWRLARLS